MEIEPRVLEDIISLVSTNMTGEVDTNQEIVEILYRGGAKVVADFKGGTTVEFAKVKFHTSGRLKLEK